MAFFEGIDSLAVWVCLGMFILTILGAYAWQLHRRVKTLEEKQQSEARETETRRQQQIDDATQGIGILAGAMVREELTLTEGCMRIAYLLTQVDESAQGKDEYSVFFQLASATSHIPVLDSWKELSSQQKKAYTEERKNIETAFGEFVIEATQGLLREPLFNRQQANN
ncbi:MAG: DUF2489 domain-containing protein [Porticoccaceae bacterium]|nr:DUF2489 domain-containing protein [Porticoccaceae bacterium]